MTHGDFALGLLLLTCAEALTTAAALAAAIVIRRIVSRDEKAAFLGVVIDHAAVAIDAVMGITAFRHIIGSHPAIITDDANRMIRIYIKNDALGRFTFLLIIGQIFILSAAALPLLVLLLLALILLERCPGQANRMIILDIGIAIAVKRVALLQLLHQFFLVVEFRHGAAPDHAGALACLLRQGRANNSHCFSLCLRHALAKCEPIAAFKNGACADLIVLHKGGRP